MNPLRPYVEAVFGLLVLLLIAAGCYFGWRYSHLENEVAQIKPLQDQVAALKQQQDTLSAEAIRRAEFDSALRGRTDTIHIALDKVTNEDPVARTYLGERIPDSVRNAAAVHAAQR